MELNYEKKYAYAEVESILNWLGEEYINKIPKKLLQTIKSEKKFGYRPEIDFTKPVENQIRKETKNIIAYLSYTYWTNSEKEKQQIKSKIERNAELEREKRKQERMLEIQKRAKMMGNTTVTASIDKALRENQNN